MASPLLLKTGMNARLAVVALAWGAALAAPRPAHANEPAQTVPAGLRDLERGAPGTCACPCREKVRANRAAVSVSPELKALGDVAPGGGPTPASPDLRPLETGHARAVGPRARGVSDPFVRPEGRSLRSSAPPPRLSPDLKPLPARGGR